MSLDPSIPLQVQGPKFESPLSMFANVMQARTMQQQFQENQIKLQQQFQAERDNQALRSALSARTSPSGVDHDGAIADLMAGGFAPVALKYADTVYEQRKKVAEGLKTEGDVLNRNLTLSSQVLQGVSDEASFQRARSVVTSLLGEEAAEHLGPTYDPAVIKEAVAWGRTASDHLSMQNTFMERVFKAMELSQTALRDRQQWDEALPRIEEQLRTALGTAAQVFSGQEDVEKTRAFMRLLGPVGTSLADRYLPEGTTYSPELVKKLSGLAIPPQQNATQAETIRHNQATEGLDRERISLLRAQLQQSAGDPASIGPVAEMVIKNPELLKDFNPTERGKILKHIASVDTGAIPSARQASVLSMLDAAEMSLRELKTLPGISGAVGAPSLSPTSWPRLVGSPSVPGSEAADYEQYLSTFKSQLALPKLEFLRGLGHMSDREFRAIFDAATALSPRMREDTFRKELGKIEQTLKDVRDRANRDQMLTSGVPPEVSEALSSLPARSEPYRLSNGTSWIKNADGSITPSR